MLFAGGKGGVLASWAWAWLFGAADPLVGEQRREELRRFAWLWKERKGRASGLPHGRPSPGHSSWLDPV